MDINHELNEIQNLAENIISGCKLVTCIKKMVRAEIKLTSFKTVIVCIQFPDNYPNVPLIIEIKSKTLSEKLLQGLTNVCETEAKKYLGKPQVLNIFRFLRNFLEENPLSCCYEEINNLKMKLTEGVDEFKLKQKLSSVIAKFINKKYFLSARFIIPNNYPDAKIEITDINTNFPSTFSIHFIAQFRELSRKCVEPPLRKPKPNEPPFKPKPSLEKAVTFLIDCVKRLPDEKCQFCKCHCFPLDPKVAETDEESPRYIVRIYCGHLFHQGCMLEYLKTPPFGNKMCQECGQRISHHKWNLSDLQAEMRWAHQQAREREFAEIEDFLK